MTQTSPSPINGSSTHILPQIDGSAPRQAQNPAYTTHQQRPKSVNSDSTRQSPMPDTNIAPRSNYVYSSSSAGQNGQPRTKPGSGQDLRSNSPYSSMSARQRGQAQTVTAIASIGSHNNQRSMADDNAAAYASSRTSQDLQSRGLRQPSAYSANSQQGDAAKSYNGAAEQTDPVTVDPSQVYDPWQEYQRKRALDQEEEKRAEERRVEEARQAEEARKAAEVSRNEELRQAEEKRKAQEIKKPHAPQKQFKAPKSKPATSVSTVADSSHAENAPLSVDSADALEAQMKAMFMKMREFHEKDPQLLAKIWEQERTSHQEDTHQTPPSTKASSPAKARKTLKTQSQTPVSSSQVQPNTSKPLVNSTPHSADLREHSTARTQERAKSLNKQQHQQQQQQVPISDTQEPPPKPPPKPSKAQTGTIWPSEKKAQLADAAANWLNAMPANNDNRAEASKIRTMLDSNPSYIQLCEQLENSGLKIDRAAFARALLTAVPEMNSAPRQQVQRPSHPSPSPQTTRPSKSSKESDASEMSIQPPAATAQSSNPRNVSHGHPDDSPGAYASSYDDTPTKGAHPVPDAVKAMPSINRASSMVSTIGSNSHAPVANMLPRRQNISTNRMQPPASKEEAARKRSFAEIVDLTEHLSEEEDSSPEDMKRRRAVGHSTLPQAATSATASDTQNGGQPSQTTKPAQVNDEHSALYNNNDIVKALDKKKALRRSTYDPKSIARDILLATGRHPEMPPLNAHLDGLTSKFRAISVVSDLSTLRWDLVDPGQPIIPDSVPAVDHGAEADNEDEGEWGSQRARAQVTIYRQIVDPATGATSTIEERITAPGSSQSKKLGRMKKRRGRPMRNSQAGVTSRPYGFGEGQPSQAPAQHNRTPAARPEPSTRHQAGSTSVRHSGNSSNAINGREGSTSTGYSAFRQQLAADGTPLPKKHGRPLGWRKYLHGSDTARATKQPNKPKGAGQAQSKADPPEPTYPVYKCRWLSCFGRLHNLDTLRKHIKMLHGKDPEDKKWRCRWVGCTSANDANDALDTEQDFFSSEEQWMRHIEKHHLTPIAWQLGDGPIGGLSDAHESDASEAYLSDAHGRQVTPRVSLPLQNTDDARVAPAATPPSTEPGPKRRGRPPGSGHKILRQQAVEAQNSLERKKRQLGPGLDRGGSILVNEKRRQGFVDDDNDEAEIVNDDDV